MLGTIAGILLGDMLKDAQKEAREHDNRVALEYETANKKAVEKNKSRNSMITGATGLAVLGAVAAYGISKLSDNGKNSEAPAKTSGK